MLENIEKYNFLNNGYISLPNVDDGAEFHNTIRSMNIMGFHEDEITGLIYYDELTRSFSCSPSRQRSFAFWQHGICPGEKIRSSYVAK